MNNAARQRPTTVVTPPIREVFARRTYGAWRAVEIRARIAAETGDDPALVSIRYTARPGASRSDDLDGIEVRGEDLGPLIAVLTTLQARIHEGGRRPR